MMTIINPVSSFHRRLQYLALVSVLLIASCSGLGVKPWQRDIHAQQEMAMDADSLDIAVDAHIYFSKEASSGGQGFAGGGCGCN